MSEICKRAFAEFGVLICALSVACACIVGVYVLCGVLVCRVSGFYGMLCM